MKDEFTGDCVEIDGGYSEDEFDFDDNFDDFIPEMIDEEDADFDTI